MAVLLAKILSMHINPNQPLLVGSFRPPKILLIEDDDHTAEAVSIFLDMAGYVCVSKKVAPDIVSLLEEHNPDVILLDYLLPISNGGNLCKEIKENQKWKNTPVAIYTAYSRALKDLSNYNCDGFLEKPFNLEELEALIKQMLDQRNSIN